MFNVAGESFSIHQYVASIWLHSFPEGVNFDPLLVLVLEQLVTTPIDSEANLPVYIAQRWYSEWERRHG